MDLLSFGAETENSELMQVYNPSNNKPIEGMTVNVRSFQHSLVQAVVKKQNQKAAMKVGRDGKPLEKTEAEKERDSLELYEALIESWQGFEIGKRVLAPDQAGIKELMDLKFTHGKNYDFVLTDVLAFAADIGNYFRAYESGGDVVKASRVVAQRAGKGDADAG